MAAILFALLSVIQDVPRSGDPDQAVDGMQNALAIIVVIVLVVILIVSIIGMRQRS